jgi:cell division protein FtsB
MRRNKRAAAMNARSRQIASQVTTPRWAAVIAIAAVTLMLCLTINYRAYTEMTREIDEHQSLSTQIDNLTSENLALQEEIHNLKSDSQSIEREARRMGLRRPTDKNPVPAN